MVIIALVLVAGLCITNVSALQWRWGKWFAMELTTTILWVSLTASAFGFEVSTSILWWESAGLASWITVNWLFWGHRSQRLSGVRPLARRPDAAITAWRYLFGLGITIWLVGVSMVFWRRDSMVGWAAWTVGGYMTIAAPGWAWWAKMLQRHPPGGSHSP